MNLNVERLEKNKAVLEIEVESEKIASAFAKAYRKLVNKHNIPGFRRGKAPRPVVESLLGKGVFYKEVIDEVVPQAYEDAIRQAGLEPIDQPQVDIIELEDGKPLKFKATVEVKPEVELGDYKQINIEKEKVEITEADIEREMRTLQESKAELVTANDETVQDGYFVTIDFTGYVDDEPFEGGSSQDYTLQVGSQTFIPGFEEQLLGARVDEEREIHVTFPVDYRAEKLAGKDAVFKVKIKEIKKKVLPSLDDELAKEFGFSSVQELRTDVENKIKALGEMDAQRKYENRVVDQVVDASKVELPEILVDREIHNLIDDLAYELSRQHLTLDDYLKYTGKDHQSLHEELRPRAERVAKTHLVLEAIAKKEGITVTGDDLEEVARDWGRLYNRPAEEMRTLVFNQNNLPGVIKSIILDKTIKFLTRRHETPTSAGETPSEEAGLKPEDTAAE